LSTKVTKNTKRGKQAFRHKAKARKKFKGLHAANEYPMGELLIQRNLLFYFVPFVFFVDELPFLG